MTLIEAQCKLESLFPDRAICIDLSMWSNYHQHSMPEDRRKRRIDFNISILPGLDGTNCSQYGGKTVADAFSKVPLAEVEPTDSLVISAEVAELETLPI